MRLCIRTVACLVIFALLGILVPKHCFATSSRKVEAKCPVCDHTFQAYRLMSSNNFGGYDSDLCPHAMGSSPLLTAIWGCPSCQFCGFSSDFEQTLTDARKKELKLWLKQNIKVEDIDSTDSSAAIPAYRRYEIAAELAVSSKTPAVKIGKLFLQAAWCCRHLGLITRKSDSQLNFDISEDSCPTFFRVLDETARKLKPTGNRAGESVQIFREIASSLAQMQIPEAELAPSYLALGKFFRSSGENQQAQTFLAKSLEKDSSEPNARVLEAIQASISEEARYQKKAAEWFEKALQQPDLIGAAKQEIMVMLAETYRRTGSSDLAEKYFLQLFDHDDLPPFFQELARTGLESLGKAHLFPHEKVREMENRRIQKALALLSDGMDGMSAARDLRDCRDRAAIFPELAKMAQSNDEFAAENALKAMSDGSQEAIDLQVTLFEKGRFTTTILDNLYEHGSMVPPEPFLKAFAETTASEYASQLLQLIRAIGGKNAVEAILARAEKEFTAEKIGNLSKNEPKEHGESLFYRKLIYSLINCDDLRALAILQRIIESASFDGYNYGYHLAEDAGTAIEFITNHYFGFMAVIERDRKPQFEQPDIDIVNNPYGTARKNLREWLEKNAAATQEQMIAVGFNEAGYSIMPASDPKCLKELIAGLSDRFQPVRYHSYNLLARRTGISFKPHIGRDPQAFPREYHEIVWLYNDWLDKNRDKLIFNEEKGAFAIEK